jgi:hypothetical protein
MSDGKDKGRFARLKHAFAIRRQESAALTPRQDEILDRLSAKVVEWDMAVPAILFLETVKPLNYVGSQALVFFGPVAKTLFTVEDYEELVALMEERSGVESLLTRIERKQAARGAHLR